MKKGLKRIDVRQEKAQEQQEALQDAMDHACQYDDVQAMERLLNAGADPSAIDRSGESFFLSAVVLASDRVAELLIRRGAKTEEVIYPGTPLLHLVAQCGCVLTLTAMIERSADVNIRDDEGRTALDVMREGGGKQSQRIIQILRRAGAR